MPKDKWSRIKPKKQRTNLPSPNPDYDTSFKLFKYVQPKKGRKNVMKRGTMRWTSNLKA